jgi:hypothetical protein
MNDDGIVQCHTEEPAQPRRGRKRMRRNYQKELADLEARVDMAIKLLRRASTASPVTIDLNSKLVKIAISTLTCVEEE